MYHAAIITLSDKGHAGQREDTSSGVIRDILAEKGYEVVRYTLLPDDKDALAAEMVYICDENIADLILTTGGTGFSPRDFTPEATLSIAERLVPGIAEAMRFYSLKITPNAMLSRGISVIRKNTLIINLPGSPKAVKENLLAVIDTLPHGLAVLKGSVEDCASR